MNRSALGSPPSGPAVTIAALAAAQVFTGLGFVLLARRLEVGRFGLFAVLYAASLAVGGLLDFGSSQVRTREFARGEHVEEARAWLVTRSLVHAMLALPFVLIVSVVMAPRIGWLPATVMACQAFSNPLSAGCLALVRARASALTATWYIAAGNLVFLVSAAMAPAAQLLAWASAAATASWFVSSVLALRRAGALYPGRVRLLGWAEVWRGASGFGLAGIASSLGGLDVVLLAAVGSAPEAARYAAVSKWVQPILLVAYGVGVHSFPDMARAESSSRALVVLRSGQRAVLFSCSLAIAVAALSPFMTALVLGNQYQSSAWLLSLLALAVIPSAISQPLVAFVQARGRSGWAGLCISGATLAVLVMVALLGGELGSYAVPASWGAAFPLMLWAFVREVRKIAQV